MASHEPPGSELATIPPELIERKIYMIRGHKVMIDRDLAELYHVPAGRLNEQVKRNLKRFPEDVMFQLTLEEATAVLAARSSGSRSQVAILKRGQNIKYLPYGFTEHGVAMLSSVLRSDRAVQMNILIVRAFVRLRDMLASHKDVAQTVQDLQSRQDEQGEQITAIIDTLNRLLPAEPESPRRRIGFITGKSGRGENTGPDQP
jgi:hypothetical protein